MSGLSNATARVAGAGRSGSLDGSGGEPPTLIAAGPHRWRVRRTGSGPVCVLLHGTGASLHSWTGVAPLLAESHTVVTLDLPGHAATCTRPGASLSLESMARDLGELFDMLELDPALVVGHSSGAALVAELALNGRLDRAHLVGIAPAILLLDGLAGTVFPPLARVAANIGWLPKLFAHRARDPRQVRRLLDGTGSRLGDAALADYGRLFSDPDHVAGVLRMMAEWDLVRLDGRLDRIAAPFLLLAGANDHTVPLRNAYRTAARLPNATLEVLDGLGHLAHEEAPVRVVEHILSFVTNPVTDDIADPADDPVADPATVAAATPVATTAATPAPAVTPPAAATERTHR